MTSALLDRATTAGQERPASGGRTVLGRLRLAGIDVALPLAVLREVVHWPGAPAALPAAVTGLVGAIDLRGTVLPVIDLREVLGSTAQRPPDEVVVVVDCDGQLFGLLADEVHGVVTVDTDRLLPVATEGAPLLMSHVFRHPEDGTVVSVLDAPVLLARTGAPTVRSRRPDEPVTSTASSAEDTQTRRTMTLVRCSGHRFALDVAHVHTTLPPPEVRPSVLDDELCRGTIEFAGREVPVVDPLVLLGLGAMEADEVAAGLVLDLGGGYVVLALTALLDLVELGDADLLPLPGVDGSGGSVLRAVTDVADVGSCLVVDGAALTELPELVALALVNTMIDGSGDPARDLDLGDGGAVGAGAPYLTYAAGAELSTPLEQVMEILPFPATLTPLPSSGRTLGILVHRQGAVPVLPLADLLGREAQPPASTSCLLLVSTDADEAGDPLRSGAGVVAFAVERLREIQPLAWGDPDHGTPRPGARSGPLQEARLVRVGGGDRLLPEIDLRRLAREHLHGGRPA